MLLNETYELTIKVLQNPSVAFAIWRIFVYTVYVKKKIYS